MSIKYADKIYIITHSSDRGGEIKSSINLRGFDRVKILDFANAADIIKTNKPDLVVVDPENTPELGFKLLKDLAELPVLNNPPSMIFLADTFDEETFLTCYDLGAKDYLIKPVNSAYLASRVLMALDETRLRLKLAEQDSILTDLSVLGQDSNVYTTEYFVRKLKREVPALEPTAHLSLLILQLESQNTALMHQPAMKRSISASVAEVLKRACRGDDIIGEFFEDKFAVMLPGTNLEGGKIVSTRIFNQLNGATIIGEDQQALHLQVSIGLAEFNGCRNYEELLHKAMDGLNRARQTDDKIQFA